MIDATYDYRFADRQRYHFETDGNWKEISSRHMGPIEAEEERRADQIDALIAERRRIERRNFKGY